MGGRGTYSVGRQVAYAYQCVDKIDGVKVLKPMDSKKSLKLPEESHTSGNKYILLDKDGVFHQYREYDKNHKVVLEIGYHQEKGLGKGDVLHIHIHQKPGIENHSDITTEKRLLSRKEYQKYKKFFKGVVIDEGEYFN